MDITINLDLSRFSEEELRSFFKDGIISRSELIAELNKRMDQKYQADEILRKFKKEFDKL